MAKAGGDGRVQTGKRLETASNPQRACANYARSGPAMIPRAQAAFSRLWPADGATRRPEIWKKSAN